MLRVPPVLAVGAVLLTSGCVFDAPRERVQTKLVVQKQRCTTTIGSEEVCGGVRKTCAQISSCAEAYYRLTACKDLSLDAMPLGPQVPPADGRPNGIPCERLCGTNALMMAERIRSQPFSPPTNAKTVCNRAA